MSKILYLLVFVCTSLSCHAGAPFFPKLVVSGTAALHKPADQIGMNLSVVSQEDTAEAALNENNEAMQRVVDALKIVGLEKGEYHTGQFSVRPIYSTRPKNASSEWMAEIIAYQVTNSIDVKTQKMELAPIIIDAAGTAGVDQIANIQFSISDPSVFRTEAITQATANAIKDAEALASAANIKLVRILDIKLDQPQVFGRAGQNMQYFAKAESAPFIEAPDVDINANVSLTFEIASKE